MDYKKGDLLTRGMDHSSMHIVTRINPLSVIYCPTGFNYIVTEYAINHYTKLGNYFEMSELEKLFYYPLIYGRL